MFIFDCWRQAREGDRQQEATRRQQQGHHCMRRSESSLLYLLGVTAGRAAVGYRGQL